MKDTDKNNTDNAQELKTSKKLEKKSSRFQTKEELIAFLEKRSSKNDKKKPSDNTKISSNISNYLKMGPKLH